MVGIWLIGSPFFVFFDPDVDEYWNPIACGVAVVVLSLTRLFSGATWPSYANAAVGGWLFASAFWLADSNQASWNNARSGAAVFVLALVAGVGRGRLVGERQRGLNVRQVAQRLGKLPRISPAAGS